MEIKGQGKITLLCSLLSEGSLSTQNSSQLQRGVHKVHWECRAVYRQGVPGRSSEVLPSLSSLETGEIYLPSGEQATPSQCKASSSLSRHLSANPSSFP